MKSVETVTVSSKGQVVIPYKLRRRLNISTKDKLIVEGIDGEIIMKPIVKLSKLRGIDQKAGIKVTTADLKRMRKEWDKEFEEKIKGM